MSHDQFEYWQYTQLTINIKRSMSTGFSIEFPMDLRFLERLRLFTMKQREILEPITEYN